MISWVYIFMAESSTMYIKFSNFSRMKEPHEIHENLNTMKINTHTIKQVLLPFSFSVTALAIDTVDGRGLSYEARRMLLTKKSNVMLYLPSITW